MGVRRAGGWSGTCDALEAEIAAAPTVQGTSVFFGGGTPNAYAPDRVAALLDRLRARFAIRADAEVSLEANPDRTLTEGLDVLRRAGIDRLSFGVQSFDERELRALGRGHDAADVTVAVARARAAGFTNVSIDLMFGTPHQTVAGWSRSLDAAIALGVEHISTYGLTIEDGTPYARWHEREAGGVCSGRRIWARSCTRAGHRPARLRRATNTTRSATSRGRGFAARTPPRTGATTPIWDLGVGAASYLRRGALDAYPRPLGL